MGVTRRDVAKLAGVSTATVSNVFNSKGEFYSEETRRRVLDVANQLNYHPNMVARSLIKSETMQLSLLINDIHNQFFVDIIHYFEMAAMKKGYMVSVCTGQDDFDKYVSNFIARRLDGLFLMISPTRCKPEKIYEMVDCGIKIVVSGNLCLDPAKVSSLEPDCYCCMDRALRYLRSFGHQRIAYLSAFEDSYPNDERLPAFRKVYREIFPEDQKVIMTGRYPYPSDRATGYELTSRLMESGQPVTAILTTNDLMAMGCMEALQKRGIRIPEDISVMGIDDDRPIVEYTRPRLTTISFNKREFAERAFGLLYAQLQGEEPRQEQVYHDIVERDSVGPAARQPIVFAD